MKKQVVSFITGLLLIISCVLLAGCELIDTGSNSKQERLITATVTHVVDGDTVHVVLSGGKKEKVRFIGVNTPESTNKIEPYGKKAAAYTKSKLDNKKVWLELDIDKRDKYGRLLAYVWLNKPININDKEIRNKMFNAELLLEGYAQLMTIPPNIKYVRYFKQYEHKARTEKKGLWSINSF